MIPRRLEIIDHPCGVAYFSRCSSCFKAICNCFNAHFSKTTGISAKHSGLELWTISLLTVENQLSPLTLPWQSRESLIFWTCSVPPWVRARLCSWFPFPDDSGWVWDWVIESWGGGGGGGGGRWPCGAYTKITRGWETSANHPQPLWVRTPLTRAQSWFTFNLGKVTGSFRPSRNGAESISPLFPS